MEIDNTVYGCALCMHVMSCSLEVKLQLCGVGLYLFVGSGSDFSLASTLIHPTFLLTSTGHFKSVFVMRRVWLFYFVEIFFSYSKFYTMLFDFYLNWLAWWPTKCLLISVETREDQVIKSSNYEHLTIWVVNV